MNLKYEAKVTSIEISQEDVILLTKILSKCKRQKTDQMLLIIKNTKDIEWMKSLFKKYERIWEERNKL